MFSRSTLRMAAETFDEQAWTQIVAELQSVRLGFINCARREIAGTSQDIERLPIVTPPVRTSPGETGTSSP